MNKPEHFVFLGSKAAGLEVCQRLAARIKNDAFKAIVCPDDTSDERSVLADFKAIGEKYNIPVLVSQNSSHTARILDDLKPTTAIVHGWYQIIPVDQFRNTLFLGFHYSPLPRYRGNAPLVWQIIEGESQLGVSFFELTTGMDEGRLVDQKLFDLGNNETIANALVKANKLALQMLDEFLSYWPESLPQLREQPPLQASYCGMRTPEDGHIDWSLPATRVHDFIRAQAPPYPGAYAFLPDGSQVNLTKSTVETNHWIGVPGAVLKVDTDYVLIACGQGAVRVYELALNGERPCSPSTLLKSMKIRLH